MEAKITAILRKHQLSITEARKKILSLFWETGNALAHGDIEQKSSEDFDRVTIYRTLQTFVEKGIIHTIPTSDNSVRYALCKDECATTYCIDEVSVPKVKLPKGFRAVQTDLVISGTCNKCEQ